MFNERILSMFDLQLFADGANTAASTQTYLNPNVTTANTAGNDLSPGMRKYYNKELLENAKDELFFNQFGMDTSLPEGNGKKVQWRKFDSFKPATKPLEEGVTPDGNKLNMTQIEAEVKQYGDYTTISDMLDLTAVDPVILVCTEEHGAQAGLTRDILTRNVVVATKNKTYAPKVVGDTVTPVEIVGQVTADCKLIPSVVNKAVTKLKKNNTPKINGKYVAIIHPSVAEDLRESEGWIEVHKYAATTEIFNGEIGELHGVRFCETNNAPITKDGADNCAVYHTLCFGKDAYGKVELAGKAMEMIVKQMGSGGTADPLDQRGTVGWKGAHAAALLYEERIVDIISGSSYSNVDEAN